MNTYEKYIGSTGTHYISNSGKDERNTYRGGQAGDQTGHEWELKAWYNRPWSVVLRYPNINVGLMIARLSCAAALNDKIGYDQGQRTTYWAQLKAAGYDPSKITVPCEEDCTAGVTANVKAAGVLLGIPKLADLPTSVYSGSMKSVFVKAGFEALTASKYLSGPNYLLPGDILLYEGHHAAANVTYGAKVRGTTSSVSASALPPSPEGEGRETGLRKGDYGSAVTAMQKALLAWKPDCLPKYGADGDFGSETERAVKAYQAAKGLPETGVYDAITREALTTEDKGGCTSDACPIETTPRMVKITGETVNVRSAPGKSGKILGVVRKWERLPYQGEKRMVGETPWYLVEYRNKNAWVSGKYSVLTDGENLTRGTKICDISKYQPDVNYDKFIADTALIILRAGYRGTAGSIHEDQKFKLHSSELLNRGVRFGVYFFSIATTEDKAREEARMFWQYAKDVEPLFWAMDAESEGITRATVSAFVDELRKLGAKKVGCYVANHLYQKYDYAAISDRMDFTWIPRYGSQKPVHPCDLWQYTSIGSVNGISGNVDLNVITGDGKSLEWFTKG